MRQYSVPQFIEREAKIAVFFTFKQFLIIVLVVAFGYILYKMFPFELFIIIFLFTAGPALALAFVSVEGQPLSSFIKNYLFFAKRGKQYVWKKKQAVYPKKVVKKKKIEVEEEGKLTLGGESRLKDLRTQVETGARPQTK